MSETSVTDAHKGVAGSGGKWARGKWQVKFRDKIIGLYWLLSG